MGIKSWLVDTGYEVAVDVREEKSAWQLAGLLTFMGFSFLICEMGKVLALLRILNIK